MLATRRVSTSATTGCRASPQLQHRRPVFGQKLVAAPRTSSRSVVCQGLFGLGLPEVAVIAGVAALIFGPSKLPELGRGLGKTVKSFQTAASEFNTELKAGMENDSKSADSTKPAEGASTPAEGAKKD